MVVDMCPQANISEMLLGGNGSGAERLGAQHHTVAHYIAERLKEPYKGELLGTESLYYLEPHGFNTNVPDNIRLVAGSPDLDLYAKGIEWFAHSGDMAQQKNSWKIVKSWLRDLLDMYVRRGLDSRYRSCIFLVDCNPSFSAYTELAFAASDKVIVPCTGDGASVRAFSNLVRVLYGIDTQDHYLGSFAREMKKHQMPVPRIDLVVQNRNRTNTPRKTQSLLKKKQSSVAFSGVRNQIRDVVQEYQTRHPEIFSRKDGLVVDVKDCNTIAPVVSYNGETLTRLQKQGRQHYPVYDKKPVVNKSQIDPIREDILHIAGLLSADHRGSGSAS